MTKELKSMSDIENERKPKNKKKETEMKNLKNNTTVKTIITVFLTLASVAALVASFYGGTQYQNTINDNTKAQVKEMAAVTSKANQ